MANNEFPNIVEPSSLDAMCKKNLKALLSNPEKLGDDLPNMSEIKKIMAAYEFFDSFCTRIEMHKNGKKLLENKLLDSKTDAMNNAYLNLIKVCKLYYKNNILANQAILLATSKIRALGEVPPKYTPDENEGANNN